MGDLSFREMLDECVKLGVEGGKMTGWSRREAGRWPR
jgi:hypothetical protein